MFAFPTVLVVWGVLALIPLLTSLAYFLASPSADRLSKRLAVSAHGIFIFVLSFIALSIPVLGLEHQKYGQPFRWLCWLPVLAIAYSFWGFNGKKMVHWLQAINFIWLFAIFIFGQMAVTGIWV
jgi:hypothetical protein